MTFPPEVWDGVMRRLRNEVPSFCFEAWLEPLEARGADRGLLLVCPSTFHRERIRDHYLPRIDACLRDELRARPDEPEAAQSGLTIELGVRARRAEPAGSAMGPGQPERGLSKPREARRATRDLPPRPRQQTSSPAPSEAGEPTTSGGMGAVDSRPAEASKTLPASVSTPYSFETFVVGPCNALAREAAFAMAREQQSTLTQLYVCAQPGMGKTHLARAVAAEASRIDASSVRYVSAEGFTNQFLAALKSDRTSDFKRRYRRRGQLLVVEDVQFLERKEATQLEFFHTISHVIDAGGRVVVTGDRMPAQMSLIGERLRSQLMSGFLAEVEPPDAQVRRAIFQAKAAHGGWRLPQECLDALVESVTGSVRDLEGVLIQLVTTAALMGRPIDLELTRVAIAAKSPARAPTPKKRTLDEVIGTVAAFFQTTPERLAARSRRQQVLIPRQIAMHLAHRYTDATVAEISRALGRDHPAVHNAITKIERSILEKPKLRYQIEAVVERLGV